MSKTCSRDAIHMGTISEAKYLPGHLLSAYHVSVPLTVSDGCVRTVCQISDIRINVTVALVASDER